MSKLVLVLAGSAIVVTVASVLFAARVPGKRRRTIEKYGFRIGSFAYALLPFSLGWSEHFAFSNHVAAWQNWTSLGFGVLGAIELSRALRAESRSGWAIASLTILVAEGVANAFMPARPFLVDQLFVCTMLGRWTESDAVARQPEIA